MKQQDILLLVVIAIISGVASFFLSGLLFSGAAREQTVSRIDQITPEFNQPDNKYFNVKSINPAGSIQIGDSNNDNPFSGN